jgi:calpain-15
MGCSIDSKAMEGDVMDDDRRPTGLITLHAYTVLDVLYVRDPNAAKKRHRLLRVRNPWGDKEWRGKWSDNSQILMSNLDLVNKEIDKLGDDEKFDPKND